ncbi:hypothetical protein AAAX96_17665 [Butyricimonas faecihominis]|uniref:hypothetical protein n=1 Tax=Butyricimonas faecihominis TaxID=1472416 RepID=UPI0032C0CCBD
MFKIINFGSEEIPKFHAVFTITVNGETKDVIPAFTDYSFKCKNFEKDKLSKSVDKTKILPTLFCFAESRIFIEEGIQLHDYTGRELVDPQDLQIPVMVYLDKADNMNLFNVLNEPLPSVIIPCESVAEAYQKVATTAYFSQTASKDDWIGLGGIVSKDDLLLQIRQFGNKYEIGGTTAQGYFGVSTNTSLLQSKALVQQSPDLTDDHRTFEQAENLFKAMVQAFGVRASQQTRYVKAVNTCISQFDMPTIMEALKKIGATEKLQIEKSKCDNKIACLQGIIIEQATLLKHSKE